MEEVKIRCILNIIAQIDSYIDRKDYSKRVLHSVFQYSNEIKKVLLKDSYDNITFLLIQSIPEYPNIHKEKCFFKEAIFRKYEILLKREKKNIEEELLKMKRMGLSDKVCNF